MQENSIKKLTLNEHLLKRLARLKDSPDVLYSLGADINELLTRPSVAIVGSRKMTPYGRRVTEKFASDLSRAGVVIISGNAFGIDVTAQKAALEAGGKVISVIPSDLNHVYPASNQLIARKIVEFGGALISEHADNKTPRADEFLARNRIIAALADAVLIPEAAERSGSLNTAKHAKEIQTPIYAVPGPIDNLLSTGTNNLIKNGAHIATSADDVLALLQVNPKSKQTSLLGATDIETSILTVLSEGVADTTLLAHKTNQKLEELQTALTMLEINGRVSRDSAGNWRLDR
ncbi:DNA-processing protein DprA [Candidatus Saccharibacteria bacterium]|nr:DNA-processing protein DprA [Candidatus Saccharibacteria bacterium]